MINDETAANMGIRFLEEEKCFKLAGGLEQGDCVDEVFEGAVRTLGKKRVAELQKASKTVKDLCAVDACTGKRQEISEKVYANL